MPSAIHKVLVIIIFHLLSIISQAQHNTFFLPLDRSTEIGAYVNHMSGNSKVVVNNFDANKFQNLSCKIELMFSQFTAMNEKLNTIAEGFSGIRNDQNSLFDFLKNKLSLLDSIKEMQSGQNDTLIDIAKFQLNSLINIEKELKYIKSYDGDNKLIYWVNTENLENNKMVVFENDFSNGLAPFYSGGVYGYMDRRGNTVIEPQYEYAHRFGYGYAPVFKLKKWFFIDTLGNSSVMFSNLNFDVLCPFNEGYSLFKGGFYIDHPDKNALGVDSYIADINIETPTVFDLDRINTISLEIENRIPNQFKQIRGWFIINLMSKSIHEFNPISNDYPELLNDGYLFTQYPTRSNQNMSLYSFDGKLIVSGYEIISVESGFCAVKNQYDSKYYYFSLKGCEAITNDIYESADVFKNGLAIVSVDSQYGVINFNERKIVPLAFTKINRLVNGFECIKKTRILSKRVIVGPNGKYIAGDIKLYQKYY